jgi:hypothetical protein
MNCGLLMRICLTAWYTSTSRSSSSRSSIRHMAAKIPLLLAPFLKQQRIANHLDVEDFILSKLHKTRGIFHRNCTKYEECFIEIALNARKFLSKLHKMWGILLSILHKMRGIFHRNCTKREEFFIDIAQNVMNFSSKLHLTNIMGYVGAFHTTRAGGYSVHNNLN